MSLDLEVGNPIADAQNALNEASPALAMVADIAVGEFIEFGKQLVNVAKDLPNIHASILTAGVSLICAIGCWLTGDKKGEQENMARVQQVGSAAAKIGALCVAAACVAVNFVPFGAAAKLAVKGLGKGLGRVVGKKLLTTAFEGKLAKACVKAFNKELEKAPHLMTAELARGIKQRVIGEIVEKEVEKIVKKDVYEILVALNRRTVSEGSLTAKLVEIGFDKGSAGVLSKDLVKNGLPAIVKNNNHLDEIGKILTEEITNELKQDLSERLAKGSFGKKFESMWCENITALEKEGKLGKTLAQELKDDAMGGVREGFEQGIERGVKKGVDHAIKRFKKARESLSMQEMFSDLDWNGTYKMPSTASLGGPVSLAYFYKFKNLADQWVARSLALDIGKSKVRGENGRDEQDKGKKVA